MFSTKKDSSILLISLTKSTIVNTQTLYNPVDVIKIPVDQSNSSNLAPENYNIKAWSQNTFHNTKFIKLFLTDNV